MHPQIRDEHTSFEGTYMYGISDSSHKMGTCVITSIGEMFPAITHNLQPTKSHQIT